MADIKKKKGFLWLLKTPVDAERNRELVQMKMYKRSIKNVAGNEGDTGFKWEACKGLYPLHRGSQDSIL
ncbi:hypothetical protein HN51_039629, partial [Arachis hypogaea]